MLCTIKCKLEYHGNVCIKFTVRNPYQSHLRASPRGPRSFVRKFAEDGSQSRARGREPGPGSSGQPLMELTPLSLDEASPCDFSGSAL